MGAREVIDEQDARIAALFEQIRAEGDVQRTAAAAPIQANYAADLSLKHIAETVGRSDGRVRQRFEASLGAPPMRYLAQYRVRKAKDLIQYSDHALKDVAGMVGFKTSRTASWWFPTPD